MTKTYAKTYRDKIRRIFCGRQLSVDSLTQGVESNWNDY